MEIVNQNVAMLSNFEVYDLLLMSQQKTKGKKPNKQSQNLATITYETSEYLSKTSCKLQNAKVIEDFLKAVKPFKLTKGEKLQVLNLRPATQVDIQLIIEEIEERLSEDEISQLLEIVNTILPDVTPEQTDDQESFIEQSETQASSAVGAEPEL